MRKKRRILSPLDKAHRDTEKALIAAVNRRDKVCQTAGYCAEKGGCSDVLQMDHAIISRKHQATFFEIRQMILLCSKAHSNKTFKNYGFDTLVHKLILEREGQMFVYLMLEKSRQIKKWTCMELETMRDQFNGLYL